MTLCNGQLKEKNGKNFVVEKEHQTCCLFLNVLQDLVIGKEQKFITFCDTMQNHFNESCLIDYVPRFGLSLETNWSVINQNVTKFKGNYPIVFFLWESKAKT